MANNWRLSEEEVRKRVSSYEQPEVTDRLYEFGQILLAANRERTSHLESKATAIAGYALAVLAFLVSREPSVVANWPPRPISFAAGCAVLALMCAGASLFVRSHAWLSDSQWFENEKHAIDDADTLKRCHVLALHAVNGKVRESNDWKANALVGAQWCLLGSAAGLGAWIWWAR